MQKEPKEQDIKNAQKALNAILGKEEFKGLSKQRRKDEFINALCGGKLCKK